MDTKENDCLFLSFITFIIVSIQTDGAVNREREKIVNYLNNESNH